MLKQCKIMTCNPQEVNCSACVAVRLKLGSVVLFIMGLASATAFSQKQLGESVTDKMIGFNECANQVKKVVWNSSKDFPTCTLKYKDTLSEKDVLKVAVEPTQAFATIPMGQGEFKVTVANPDKLFSEDGNLLDIHLSALLIGGKVVSTPGSGGGECITTVHFNASGTHNRLQLEKYFNDESTYKPRFEIDPPGQAVYKGLLGTEARFERVQSANQVKITFAYVDPGVGHEIPFTADLPSCGDTINVSVKFPKAIRVTPSKPTETDISSSKQFHGQITFQFYQPNQYYSAQACIPDFIDYNHFYWDWYGVHYAVYRATWTTSFGYCQGYWWTRNNFGNTSWYYGPRRTTWWSYYWQHVGWT
jgi:hypothetical protein